MDGQPPARVFAGALLALAVVGTWVLGVRFEESRLPQDFVSLFIGVGVVVVLWALLIATTPQEITLKGSVLTIHNSPGSESFDLADGLQPIDIVGTPRSASGPCCCTGPTRPQWCSAATTSTRSSSTRSCGTTARSSDGAFAGHASPFNR